MLKKMKISTKVIILGLAIVMLFSLVVVWIGFKYSNSMYDAKEVKTREHVDTAQSILVYYEALANSGELSLEEAQTRAKETIKNLRYGNNEYFFIVDTDVQMIMHPIKPEMEGTNRSEDKDPNGKKIFVAMVELAKKEGAGFVDYYWAKPGLTKAVPKISYVKLYPQWNWVVGSGIYVDDVQKEVGNVIILFAIVIVVLLGVILSIFLLAINKIVISPVKTISGQIEKIANGNLDIDIKVDAASKDEIGSLAQSVNKIVNSLQGLITDTDMFSKAVLEGKFETRADVSKYSGDYAKIVSDVNKMLDTVNDRNIWYEAIIDAVPFPIHVTDNDMNWTYMNKGFEKLMIEQGVVKDRKSGYGKACSNAGANICNTQNCGIKQLQKGKPESYFDWCGMSCKQDTSYLKNHKGESIGFVEVVTDLTSILRVNDYTKFEVDRLAANLDLLASGDFNLNLNIKEADQYTKETKENFEKINNSIRKVKEVVGSVIDEVGMLTKTSIEGKLDTRGDVNKFEGGYREIVAGVNATLDVVVDKNDWYEAIIDAVPFPIHVIDKDMKWTYLNKAFETLMIDAGVAKDRTQAVGMPCSSANANICNTANCGIKQLNKGNGETLFDWCGMNCKQNTSHLINRKGEKTGYVEVVTDLTSILRVGAYTKDAVDQMATNLDLLAKGDFNLNLTIKEADQYTKEAKENFEKINGNISKVKEVVGTMIDEVEMLTKTSVEGKLDTRGDVSKFTGGYKDVIDGLNKTLDAVVNPLSEGMQVLAKMSVNDYTVEMTGKYKGTLKEFADSINGVNTQLLAVQTGFVNLSKGDTSLLEQYKATGKKSENDRIVPSIIAAMETINSLIQEIDMLAQASANGNLELRGHAGNFEGGYQQIIQGINNMLDLVGRPVQEAADVLEEMAKGNLTVEVTGAYKGDHAKIKEALNSAIRSFNEVLNDIASSAQQVASGSRQVSDSAQALSQGSTEQASSIEQLTASIEEISSQTKLNAQNANQANELALNAKEDATKGNDQMKGMLRAMEEINDASGSISKIIKVIDEIAFQTNILALNAAVEAARAGQHGKGFAVVAEEVRNLAARSANAAKETTVLIEGSIKKAEGGTKIASETANALTKIVDGVAKAASLVGEIAAASNEQATGIAQINQGIMQVSQVTQTNSATSEESAAASEELSSQSEMLKEMVGKFTLKKVDSTVKCFDELNPDVLRMLENMADKKKSSSYKEARSEVTASKKKIALSDKEFGKY